MPPTSAPRPSEPKSRKPIPAKQTKSKTSNQTISKAARLDSDKQAGLKNTNPRHPHFSTTDYMANLPKRLHPKVDLAQRNLLWSLDYMNKADRGDVLRACEMGEIAHINDVRKSGEPYITHPIAVAEILAGFRQNRDVICAAILHDTVEDTTITHKDVEQAFGERVAKLVDGVTKLKSSSHNKLENKAATLSKIIDATRSDFHVLMIKLADRLHNMSTMDAVRPEKQRATAQETLNFYVPFGKFLGFQDLAEYIEVLCYHRLNPERYQMIQGKLIQQGLGRRFRMDAISIYLSDMLDELDISGHVRVLDNDVAIYRDFFNDKGDPDHLIQQYAFTVVLHSVEDCYLLAEQLVADYHIPPKYFHDNIRHPSFGGNQSLILTYHQDHATFRITILTRQMEKNARVGAVAWQNASEDSVMVLNAMLRNVDEFVNEHDEIFDSDLLNKIYSLFADNKIICYSPQGEPYYIHQGATALDFAYAVGPKVGHVATGATIDGKPAKLGTMLEFGETVEIETDPTASPRPEWLGVAITPKARNLIQDYLAKLPESEQYNYGKQSLNWVLQKYDKSLADMTEADWQNVLAWQNCSSKSELYARISQGVLLPQFVVMRLFSDDEALQHQHHPLTVEQPQDLLKDAYGIEVHFSACCHPIYGDDIVGHMTRNKGLMIHRKECQFIKNEKQRQPYELMQPMLWRSKDELESLEDTGTKPPYFTSNIHISSVLSDQQVSQVVHDLGQIGIKIEEIDLRNHDTIIRLQVRGIGHLQQGIDHIKPLFVSSSVGRKMHQ